MTHVEAPPAPLWRRVTSGLRGRRDGGGAKPPGGSSPPGGP
ncbi:hypothetical protein [Actinomadura madurae]|nr:hypothetical protein [Actinomadura madurae]